MACVGGQSRLETGFTFAPISVGGEYPLTYVVFWYSKITVRHQIKAQNKWGEGKQEQQREQENEQQQENVKEKLVQVQVQEEEEEEEVGGGRRKRCRCLLAALKPLIV